jgi:hypothetical protein
VTDVNVPDPTPFPAPSDGESPEPDEAIEPLLAALESDETALEVADADADTEPVGAEDEVLEDAALLEEETSAQDKS